MTSDCTQENVFVKQKHLSNRSDLPVTVLQFTSNWSLVTCHFVKQTPVIIAILTSIFTCHDRTCWFITGPWMTPPADRIH